MSIWTDERVDLLKRMHGKGCTPREIAGTIGRGISRKAVIGKAWRMGLAFSDGTNAGQDLLRNPRQPRKRYPIAGRITQTITPRVRIQPDFPTEPLPIPMEELYVAPENRKKLLDLEPNDCRWPLGDPREADFHFCAGPKVPGFSYCQHHIRKAHQTAQEVDARRLRAMKAA